VGGLKRRGGEGSSPFLVVPSLGYASRMSRPHRSCPAGEVFQVLNRAVAWTTIFDMPEDYDAFPPRVPLAAGRPVRLGSTSPNSHAARHWLTSSQ